MFVIEKNNKILLTKGDTATMLVEIYDLNNEKYEIQSTDVITMTVKKNGAATASLTKTATTDHFIIINPSDTTNLTPGLYVYDVQITTDNDAVYTIVPTSFFELLGEVS